MFGDGIGGVECAMAGVVRRLRSLKIGSAAFSFGCVEVVAASGLASPWRNRSAEMCIGLFPMRDAAKTGFLEICFWWIWDLISSSLRSVS